MTFEEREIIKILKEDPKVTQKRIGELTGLSVRTIKRRTAEMKGKGLITREDGKRNGKWIVLTEV